MFYSRGGGVVSLPCTNSGSAAKHLKESDLVVTQPVNIFSGNFDFDKMYFSELENISYTIMMDKLLPLKLALV